MGFSSRLSLGNNDKGKRRDRSLLLCVIIVNHTSPSMRRRYHHRHLNRRQKTERPPTNNALAWLTRTILMRRILEFRRELCFSRDSTFDSPSRFPAFLITNRFLCIHTSIALATLPSHVFPKATSVQHVNANVPDFRLPLANEKYQGLMKMRDFIGISFDYHQI